MKKIPLKMKLGIISDPIYSIDFSPHMGPIRKMDRTFLGIINRSLWYIDYYEPFEYEGKMWKVVELYDNHIMLVEEIIDDKDKER